jgi:ABC-type nitrate/sulfonate/bicarbonate transport system substrate-binding protein
MTSFQQGRFADAGVTETEPRRRRPAARVRRNVFSGLILEIGTAFTPGLPARSGSVSAKAVCLQ